MKHGFKLGETEYDVALSRAADGYVLHAAGGDYPFKLVQGESGDWVLHASGEVRHVHLATHGDDVFIHVDGQTHQLRYEHPLQRLAELAAGAAEDSIRASMPGSLIALHVDEGQRVAKGDKLLVMESMKMETSVPAPRDAVVAQIHVNPGQTFDKDALLISLAPQENP